MDCNKCYFDYELDNTIVNYGDIVFPTTALGTKDGVSIYPSVSAKVVKILKKENSTIVTLFSSNYFKLYVYASQYDYFTYVFKKDEAISYFLVSDNKKIKVKFVSLDYEYELRNGKVRLIYDVVDDNMDLIPGVTGALHVEYFTLTNAYIISKDIFGNNIRKNVYNLLYRKWNYND